MIYAVQTVHTSGVNWSSLSVILGGVFFFLSTLSAYAMWRFGRWSDTLGRRLDSQDQKIDLATEAAQKSAVAAAELKGYLAGAIATLHPQGAN